MLNGESRILLKYMFRKLFRRNRKIFISLVLISGMAISLLIAFLNSYAGLSKSFSDYFIDYHFPDVTLFSSSLFAEDIQKEVEAITGVTDVSLRLCVDSQMVPEEGAGVSVRCYSMDEKGFPDYYVIKESELNYSEQTENDADDVIHIAMEACFVELAGYQLGDVFTICIGETEHKGVLTQIVTSPECAVVYRDEKFNFSTDEFGYAFFSYEQLKELSGVQSDLFNQILVQTASETDAKVIKNKIIEIIDFEPETAVMSYTYEDSAQKAFVDSCVEPLYSLSYLLSTVFFLIAMLMIYLFMYQIIKEQKETIGIYMALGISKRSIATLYYAFGAAILIFAAILGNGLGYLLTRYVADLYQQTFYLPAVECKCNPLLILVAVLINGIIVELAVFLAERQIFKLEPVEAMRKNPFIAVQKERRTIPFFNKVVKVCISCSIRNKRRLLLSFLSTILTTALLVFAFQYMESGRIIIKHTFSERYLYDGQVMFDGELEAESAEALLENGEGIEGWEFFSVRDVTIKANEKTVESTLYGVEAEGELLTIQGKNGNPIKLSTDGVVLSQQAAGELGVHQGELVQINDQTFTVTDISIRKICFLYNTAVW
ncbi:MAG: ABC transporter permease [Eubacteriales bacterium]|nr:ABC transporter permease [Eubacteriales bacterium]